MKTVLFSIFENILKIWKIKSANQWVCLDLSTIFATVNHKILPDVLENYFGIVEQALP